MPDNLAVCVIAEWYGPSNIIPAYARAQWPFFDEYLVTVQCPVNRNDNYQLG